MAAFTAKGYSKICKAKPGIIGVRMAAFRESLSAGTSVAHEAAV